jgi:hypothetical protein
MPYGGERILPYYPPTLKGYGKPYTELDVINIVIARQRVLAQYNNELWTMFHPAFSSAKTGSIDHSTHPHVGNEHLWACYDAMKKEFPEHARNQFISRHIHVGPPVKGAKVWVGAEYASGVVPSARKPSSGGLWGLVMGAVKPCWPRMLDQPGPTTYEAVEQAIGILKEIQRKT